MTLNTLFLPLLGGFLFYYISHWTSYFAVHQPAQAVLFFSAFTGVCLLIVARLVTYFCDDLSGDYTQNALRVGVLAIPPLLFSQTVGWGVALLQSNLEGTRVGRPKALLALVSTLISIVVVVNISSASALLLPRFWGVPIAAMWLASVLPIFALAIPWSRISNMPLSSVLVRASTLSLVVLISIYWALPEMPNLLEFWGGVTKPIGEGKAVEGIGTAFLACVLGPLLAFCFNVLYTRQAAAARLVRHGWASGLEQLIYTAARRQKLLMFTLDDHKVYVGIVEAVFGNQRSRDAYVKILPLMSGYRNKDDHKVKFTTYYKSVYRLVNKDSPSRITDKGPRDIRSQFEKVLPVERIVSAGQFSSQYFQRFREQDSPTTVNVAHSHPKKSQK